jgi:phenylacetate-CoA ligase
VTFEQWREQLAHVDHRQWIVQRYVPSIELESMQLVGTLLCSHGRFYSLGVVRASPHRVVNIARGGTFHRCYVHRERRHSAPNGNIIDKQELHKQLITMKSTDRQWNRRVYVSSSGGTGGNRLFFLTDIEQNRMQRRILVRLMLEQRLVSSDDVCLNLFRSGDIYRSLDIFNDFCDLVNCTALPMGADTSDENVLSIIEYFRPSIVMGTPHRLMKLALHIEQQSTAHVEFTKIFFAGEPLDRAKQSFLERIFRCSSCIGFYGSAETGVIACQSMEHRSSKVYLYPKQLVKIDIDRSRIIVTNLVRRRNQLVRFDTGDHGRLLATSDNEPYGLVEVLSSDRLLLFDSHSLHKSDIEQMMSSLELVEWQLLIDDASDRQQRIELLFRVMPTSDTTLANVEQSIEAGLHRCFQGQLAHFSEKLRRRYESIAIDDFIRSQTSGKLLRVIDRRSSSKR